MSSMKAHPAVQFNLQDTIDRPTNEVFKSVTMTPLNASGEFRTLGPKDSWEERRGALNAMVDFFFEAYTLEDGIHLYASHNPKRVGGAIGWIRSDKIKVVGITGCVVIDKKLRTVTLPHRKDRKSGQYVLAQMTPWVIAKDYGSSIEVFNAPIDPKTFKNAGCIKHNYVNELLKGIRITAECTIHKYTDWETGKVTFSEGTQRKAQWFERTLNPRDPATSEPLEFDFEAAKKAWILSNQQFAATQEAVDTAKAHETEEEHEAIVGTVVARANGQEPADDKRVSGETWVDGKLTDINEVSGGLYWPVNVNAKGEKVSSDGPAIRIYGAGGLSVLYRASKNPRKGFVKA